jgi:uncharacterized repeat protein (TIGR01451 family)
VINGNTAGDTDVVVDIGTLPGNGDSRTITYDVVIDNPLATGVTQLVNQGLLTSNEVPDVLTDDPLPPGADDPTIVPVNVTPELEVSKQDSLLDDADGNTFPSPGDTLRYTIVITNSGNGATSNVIFTDTPDVNTALVPGSVTTTQGSITGGNAGTPPVTVDLGIIAGGGASATVTFDVLVDLPLADGVTGVNNQARVDSEELPPVFSDDPDTLPEDDTTATPLLAAPVLDASKSVTLLVDADMNSQPSPGDTLRYDVAVINSGNQDASGVVFTDTPDANTMLVVGSVTTTDGTITSGNTGTAPVTVDIGILAGQGGQVDISYEVIINDPLPAGVTQVMNQGRVDSIELPSEPTDDPGTGPDNDPTIISLTASPIIVASKSDSLFADNDGNSAPSPGDELLYTVTITNTGNQEATGVVFSDIPDSNTTLVPGSVSTTRGTITDGNAGTPPVSVDVGMIMGAGDSVSISFRVIINDPLPGGVTSVSNQGLVSTDQTPVVPTDDPDSADPDDPTNTPVTAAPELSATKQAILLLDADGDTLPSPGDTIRYTVNITNDGNVAATDVIFSDTPDVNGSLQTGSVTVALLGTVINGNTAGDTDVVVDIGTLPGNGDSRTITYDVVIDNPLAAGVTRLRNQGSVGSNELPDEQTDDPDLPGDNQPTFVDLTAAPVLSVTKNDTLFIDADGNSQPSPGDTLLYNIVIVNTGNQGATATFVNDILDPNVALSVGSVNTDRGAVSSGNNPGDVGIAVDVGTIPGGGESAMISFLVTINNPLPAGVTVVANQATVTTDELPPIDSDDPDTPPTGDPTITPVTTTPAVEAFKSDSLLIDADGDGQPSPGDTLRYAISIQNTGNVELTGLSFKDTPGTNTQLVEGSVITTLGTVLAGNGSGDTGVNIDIGNLGGGASVSISFDVLIDNPLPASVLQVQNQGVVSADGLPEEPTDDPDSPTEDDPTPTPISAEPILELDKTATLLLDADGDGLPSPGDTISYALLVSNIGNTAATNVVLTDTPDPNGEFQAGTVLTSTGVVTLGNSPGDTAIAVDIGTLPGGGATATAGYQVLVPDPLPVGVTELINQAYVVADGLPSEPSNDTEGTADDDETIVPLTATPILNAFKDDSLATDADGDGLPSPGDTLRYTVTIINSGNSGASGVVFMDIPDENTQLVGGTVVTSRGTVIIGSLPGDTTVAVDVGIIPGSGESATITFDVTIDAPLPAGVTQLVNQGTVDSAQLPTIPTDDPNSLPPDDPTITPVTAAPVIDASKAVSLQNDADGNGAVSPGDTLLYLVDIQNSGNGGATQLRYLDQPDANSTLVAGSVASTAGSIVSGNGGGDTSIEVSIGGLPGGDAISISYLVTVNNPLPAGVTELVNQGLVASNELPTEPTDDPSTAAGNDPTVVPLVAEPRLVVTKVAILILDADGDGSPSPGDTLSYIVRVNNDGNQAAVSSFVNDDLDTNLTLVVGSVATSQGAVTQGNTVGDTDVAADFGNIEGGGQVTLSFDATINNPLPLGVTGVSNQAVVFSDNAPPQPSDDPDSPPVDDPTITPVVSAPLVEAFKSDILFVDADANGVASPGDTLMYVIVVSNQGNAAAGMVQFGDTPDLNTTLVSGSVATDRGSVILGNNPGDSQVNVELGTLPGAETANITFMVTINNPVDGNATTVSNQGQVSGSNIPDEPTDDPDSPAGDDPTITPIDADPSLSLSKSAVNTFDEDGNGFVSGGDRVDYLLILRNTGNGTANNLRVTDTPDANTELINGSVTVSTGTITTGNTPGDDSIDIAITSLSAGSEIRIAYQVRINSPLPASVTDITNQAIATSDDTDPVSSDDPASPGVDDPTVVPLGDIGQAAIGLAKRLLDVQVDSERFSPVPLGSALVNFEFRIDNPGMVDLSELQVSDDLASTFPSPATFEVRNVTSSQLSINVNFDGSGDTRLLDGTDVLPVGEFAFIQLSVLVTPRDAPMPFYNSATAAAIGGSRNVTDVSHNGTDSDPEGDGSIDNSDPTPVEFVLRMQPVPTLSTWAVLLLMVSMIAVARRRILALRSHAANAKYASRSRKQTSSRR